MIDGVTSTDTPLTSDYIIGRLKKELELYLNDTLPQMTRERWEWAVSVLYADKSVKALK